MTETTTYDSDMVITKRVAENPKRAGSAAFDRFALYRTGMKVSTFLEKGGTRADLSWDTARGFISVAKAPRSTRSRSSGPTGPGRAATP